MGFQDIGTRIFEFVAKTQFLYELLWQDIILQVLLEEGVLGRVQGQDTFDQKNLDI